MGPASTILRRVSRRLPLTRERIVKTALQMADRDGFDAVTLRRLAADLGVHVTSLYNHVPNRDAVTDGVVELLLAEAKLPLSDFTWQDWVRHFSAAMRTIARTHPGGFVAFQRRPIQGPDAAASFEAALAAFREAGFDVADAYNAVQSTAKAMLGLGIEEAELVSVPSPPRTDVSVLPPDRFPNINAIIAVADDADTWTFMTETLIAGFAARLQA